MTRLWRNSLEVAVAAAFVCAIMAASFRFNFVF